MNLIFDFKGHKYSYNSDTQELLRVTPTGKVPVSVNHPSVHGIKDFIEENSASR